MAMLIVKMMAMAGVGDDLESENESSGTFLISNRGESKMGGQVGVEA